MFWYFKKQTSICNSNVTTIKINIENYLYFVQTNRMWQILKSGFGNFALPDYFFNNAITVIYKNQFINFKFEVTLCFTTCDENTKMCVLNFVSFHWLFFFFLYLYFPIQTFHFIEKMEKSNHFEAAFSKVIRLFHTTFIQKRHSDIDSKQSGNLKIPV